jgi:hypothetical protein
MPRGVEPIDVTDAGDRVRGHAAGEENLADVIERMASTTAGVPQNPH